MVRFVHPELGPVRPRPLVPATGPRHRKVLLVTQSHRRALTRLAVLAVAVCVPAAGLAPAEAGAGPSASGVTTRATSVDPSVPAPTSVEAVEVAPHVVEVRWVEPEVAEGAPAITGYVVRVVSTDPEGDARGEPAEVGDTSVTVTDVDRGTYTVIVRATDAEGDFADGTADEPLEVAGHLAPEAPTLLRAEQADLGELRVDWDPVLDDRGYTVVDYLVELRPTREGASAPPAQVVPGDGRTTARFTRVPVGTYDLVVTARSDGQPAAAVLAGVKVVAAPGAVRSVVAEQTAPGTVRLSWAAPVDSTDVDSYLVQYGLGRPTNGASVGPTTFSRTIERLKPGSYVFVVRADAAEGQVAGTPVTTKMVVTNAAPVGAPTLKVADARLKRGQKLKVSGKAAPRTQLQVQLRTAGSADFQVLRTVTTTARGTYATTAAVPGAGEVRVVDVATGRTSPVVGVTVTATGR